MSWFKIWSCNPGIRFERCKVSTKGPKPCLNIFSRGGTTREVIPRVSRVTSTFIPAVALVGKYADGPAANPGLCTVRTSPQV